MIVISLNLSVHAQDRRPKEMPKHKRPQFLSLDLDGDGYITYVEFEQSDVPNNDHASIFGHIDADGDGILTKQDFTSHKPLRRKR